MTLEKQLESLKFRADMLESNKVCKERCEAILLDCILECASDDTSCSSQCIRLDTDCIDGKIFYGSKRSHKNS